MAKSEWEKTRDTMDFIEASNGRPSVGIGGALGQQAHQGRQWGNTFHSGRNRSTKVQTGHVSQAETDRSARLISGAPVRRLPVWLDLIEEPLLWIAIVVGAVFGVWMGATRQFEPLADRALWQSVALAAGTMAATFGFLVYLLIQVVAFATTVLLPVLLKLAKVAIGLGLLYLILTNEI